MKEKNPVKVQCENLLDMLENGVCEEVAERVNARMRESGYDGSPIEMMALPDFCIHAQLAIVTKLARACEQTEQFLVEALADLIEPEMLIAALMKGSGGQMMQVDADTEEGKQLVGMLQDAEMDKRAQKYMEDKLMDDIENAGGEADE